MLYLLHDRDADHLVFLTKYYNYKNIMDMEHNAFLQIMPGLKLKYSMRVQF